MSQNPADGGSPQDPEPGWQSPSEGGAERPDLQKPAPQPPPTQQYPQYQPPPGYGQPQGPPQYGQPQYGQPQYGQPQYEQPQYGQPQYGQPQYPPAQGPPPAYAPPPGYPPQGPSPQGQQPAPPYRAPGYGGPQADKPGVIPLRPLAVGELLDGAFATIRLNPKAMLGLSFVIVLVGQIIVLALNLVSNNASDGVRFAVTVATQAVTWAMTTIATGAVVIVVGEAVLGSRIAPAEVLERLRGRVWRLIGLGLLVTLLTIVSLIGFFIGAIFVGVLLALATPAFVLEKSEIRASLRRSANLVQGAWWRTFGILLLAGLVATIIGGLVQLPFTLFAVHSSGFLTSSTSDISTGSQILLALGRVVGGTITTPILAGTIALMYVDRRMRREGLDIVLAQSARERRGQS